MHAATLVQTANFHALSMRLEHLTQISHCQTTHAFSQDNLCLCFLQAVLFHCIFSCTNLTQKYTWIVLAANIWRGALSLVALLVKNIRGLGRHWADKAVNKSNLNMARSWEYLVSAVVYLNCTLRTWIQRWFTAAPMKALTVRESSSRTDRQNCVLCFLSYSLCCMMR